jgi:hypothetical protein
MQSLISVFAGILLLSGLGKYRSVIALSPTADIWEDVLYLAEQGDSWPVAAWSLQWSLQLLQAQSSWVQQLPSANVILLTKIP